MIDICLNLASFKNNKDKIIQNGLNSGLNGFIFTGTSLFSTKIVLEENKKYLQYARSTAGVHPHSSAQLRHSSIELINSMLDKNIIAVGECGLDYDRMYESKAIQMHAFSEQIEIAKVFKKPLFLHVRPKMGEEKDIIKDFFRLYDGSIPGVVHCFTGNQYMLDAFLDYGLYIGITGWVCDNKRGKELQNIISKIPDELLMVETDAPYLTPKNMPKNLYKRENEPAFLPYIVNKLGELRQQSYEEISKNTDNAVNKLFKWKPDKFPKE